MVIVVAAKFDEIQYIGGQRRHIALNAEHPPHALRGQFAGVGQLNNYADEYFFSEWDQHAPANVTRAHVSSGIIKQCRQRYVERNAKETHGSVLKTLAWR